MTTSHITTRFSLYNGVGERFLPIPKAFLKNRGIHTWWSREVVILVLKY